ncbi:HAD family hydrolase [Brachybacterium sp. YJGR34]|uniref:HAD family hydrolase n=1 Tax=Brachybacterium sp. YJGR34 TaxID=2059911 RepID=UPI000E0A79D2|nr:HAD family hydrolase [Brachybacterium sp. YJGR34]
MDASLLELRDLVTAGAVRAVVTDLDGVLRRFDPGLWEVLDSAAGVPAGTCIEAILGHPYLPEVVRGRGTHARWRSLARASLREAGVPPRAAEVAVAAWAATPARIDQQVLSELERHRARGCAVFVLTNGTDRVPEELSALGLDAFLGRGRRFLLNSADLGAAKPEPEAFSRAAARIAQALGEEVPPARLALLDDTEGHVRAARESGWRGIVHRPA